MEFQALNHRIFTLDVLRTFAISLMVVFHFIYDLKFFGYVNWDTPDGGGWRTFRQVILSSFFICLGASLHLSYARAINWNKFSKRLAQILVSALAVTLMSLLMVAEHYIYFGVLHFIAVASLLCVNLAKHPRASLLMGVCIIAIYNAGWVSDFWPFTYVEHKLPSYTNDYVGLFPWLGMVCLGIWLASTAFFQQDPLHKLKNNTWMAWPGNHSLAIYLLHQPVLFVIFGLIAYLSNT
jgi:uncharacterized membrane protein